MCGPNLRLRNLLEKNKWAEMFPCMIARTSTTDVISSGMGGTRNGALQLMHGELQVLSPLVPVREVNFLRFCKQHAEGVWAVVDVSVDSIRETPGGGGGSPPTFPNSRRLPSGCLVQDMPNGYSKSFSEFYLGSFSCLSNFRRKFFGRIIDKWVALEVGFYTWSVGKFNSNMDI